MHKDGYTYSQGILKLNGKIYIGSTGGVRQKVLAVVRSSAIGGHSDMQACYQRDKAYFYWNGMKKDLVTFIQECDVCQQNKVEHTPPAGLLQSLPVPDQAWKHLSMDFITGLPKS